MTKRLAVLTSLALMAISGSPSAWPGTLPPQETESPRGPFSCLFEADVHSDPASLALCQAGLGALLPDIPIERPADEGVGRATPSLPPPPCVPVPGGVPAIVTTARDDKCEAIVGAYTNPKGAGGLGASPDLPADMAIAPSGDAVFVTGTSQEQAVGFGVQSVAFSKTGELLWSSRHEGAQGGSDVGLAVAASPLGDLVFVTGYEDGSSPDMITIAHDAATGAVEWMSSLPGVSEGPDLGTDITVSPDGSRVYVTGTAALGADEEKTQDLILLAYEAETGEELWRTTYASPRGGLDQGLSLVASDDGRAVYVAGLTPGTTGELDYLTLGVRVIQESSGEEDNGSGEIEWVRRYDGGYYCGYDPAAGGVARCDDIPTAIALSPDGASVYVTGTSGESLDILNNLNTHGNWEWATVAYSTSSGDLLWLGREHGRTRGLNAGMDIAPSPDGKLVYVTGMQSGELSAVDSNYATLAYEADDGRHALIFGGTFGYSGPARNSEGATAIAVAPDNGTVYVTGYSGVGSEEDPGVGYLGPANVSDDDVTVVATQAHQANDNFQWRWVARYGSLAEASQDVGLDAQVTPDGKRLYVLAAFRYLTSEQYAGSQGEETNFFDYGLLAYDL